MKFTNIILQEPTIFLLMKLWHFAREQRKNIVLFIGLLIIANCILLVAPLIFGAFIGEIEAHGVSSANISYLMLLLALLVLKEFGFWLFHGPARLIERLTAFTAALNYRRYLLQGVLDLRLSWHGEHDSGDTIDKVNKAGEGLADFGQNVFQIIQILVKLFGTSLVLLWFSPWIGGGVFIFAILTFVVIFQFDKRLIPQYRGLNEFSNKASASIFDALSNITTVKILHIEGAIHKGVISRFMAARQLYRANAALNEYKWFTAVMCIQFILVVPLGLYIYYKYKIGEALDVGVISTLYLYLSELAFLFWGFGSFYEQLAIFKNRLFNAEPIERAFKARDSIRRKPGGRWQQIAIQNLYFRYEGMGEVPSLDHIAIKITRGERIAVIGESGSGKTTFLKVLHGMYPNANAVIAFDDRQAVNTCFADLDLKTMLVPQEPEIFSSTIRDNITLGIEHEDRQVLKVARIAAFDTVIAQLNNGLDAVINEKGVNLSGGQKQRLALTRALLFSANKDILLLDESTSSVDPENEYEIYQNIWQAFAGKTIIAAIHKMNLLKLFDRIVIFDKSRVIDEGTFDSLLQHNVAFRRAWEEFVTTGTGSDYYS